GHATRRSSERYAFTYLAEPLVTAFMSLYPREIAPEPYACFRDDVLGTLAVANMDQRLWRDGEVRINTMLWPFPNGCREQDCRDICGDFSALMFFCLKYLTPSEITH